MTVIELRQYVLHPHRRPDLVELFDRELIEPQEQHGLSVIGTFTDRDDPDRFVWFRGFPDMDARALGLTAFYDGPVWQRHRSAANATMTDSDNVLLLRPVSPFADVPVGVVEVTVLSLEIPAEAGFLQLFQKEIEPALVLSGSPLLALLVTDPSPNNFSRLPVREGELVLVRVAGFPDAQAYADHVEARARDPRWQSADAELHRRTTGRQTMVLTPTPRSRLNTRPGQAASS